MPHRLAQQVAQLSLEDLSTFVAALPRVALLSLCALAEDRVEADRWAHRVPAPPVVVTAGHLDPDDILTAEEAADAQRISLDTLYSQVRCGLLLPLPRCYRGRLRFRRGDLKVANGVDRRYIRPHDSTGRADAPPPARLDATRTRRGLGRHGDDGRAVGARRPGRDAPRRDEPWAPGQGAWADPQGDPRPKGGGA